jgi:hypothetical protein
MFGDVEGQQSQQRCGVRFLTLNNMNSSVQFSVQVYDRDSGWCYAAMADGSVFFPPEVQVGIRRWIDVDADRGALLVAAADQLLEKGMITCMHYGMRFR